MVENFIKEIEEIKNSFPSRTTIMEDYINNCKKSFVGTYDELQKRMKEVREEAKQIYYKKKDENDKLIQLKEAEMLDYLFDYSLVKKLPNGRKVFDKLWEKAWRDEHSCGYYAVYSDYEEKEADFMELYSFIQGK
jgi:hypothetical protein